MKELKALIGLPGSGKSTYATELVSGKSNWIRVNRDDLRQTMFNRYHDPSMEETVTKVQDFMIKTALEDGFNVVVDNCNIDEKYRNALIKIAKNVGDVTYQEKVFKTSLHDCIKFNEKRERVVPEDVINKMAKKGRETLWGKYKPKTEHFPKIEGSMLLQDDSLPKAIMCDLDGTLALMNGRNPYDASTADQDLPNYPVLETIKTFQDKGYEIIFCSGREDRYREPTLKFLATHFVKDEQPRPFKLFMRKTGDSRKDSIIKKEIFDSEILGKFFVLFVLDDRDQVVQGWRDIGLTCFQVAPGAF